MSDTAKFHCVIIPDSSGGTPFMLEADTLEALQAELFGKLIESKSGWCHIFQGTKMQLSSVRQVFSINTPGGLVEVKDTAGTVFEANGRFNTLRSAT